MEGLQPEVEVWTMMIAEPVWQLAICAMYLTF